MHRRTAVCFLALLGLAYAPARAARSGEIPVGGRLPDVLMRGLNGPARRLSEYRGRPLIINVWASWCGPCMEEMSSLERLAWLDDRMPFSMIGVSTDDDVEAARAVLRRNRATLRHFIDHDLELETLLGARTIPLTVLVDADGRVVDKIDGSRQWDSPESLRLIARAFRLGRTPGAAAGTRTGLPANANSGPQ